jgi:hypothetical protein
MEIYLGIKSLRDTEYKISWSKTVYNIDVLAGIIAGGNAMITDSRFVIGFKRLGIKLYMQEDETYDDFKKLFYSDTDITNYIYYYNINKDEIYNQPVSELDDYKGLWVKNQNNNYNLYKFKDTNFIKGLIYICDLFGFSWLSYIDGKPFDANGNTYTIPGYLENTPKNVLSYIDDYDDDDNDDETIYQHKEEDD